MSASTSQGEIVVGLDIGTTKVCAVVSGGNLDSSALATILGGRVPA